jgi:hypothetical protein
MLNNRLRELSVMGVCFDRKGGKKNNWLREAMIK